jgi:hypothetical protein
MYFTCLHRVDVTAAALDGHLRYEGFAGQTQYVEGCGGHVLNARVTLQGEYLAQVRVCTSVYMHAYMYVCVYMYTCVCVCVCVCVRARVRVYMHT